MLGWISANGGTLAVCSVVIILAALAVRSLVKDNKQGKSSCGCGCSSCAMSGQCHKK